MKRDYIITFVSEFVTLALGILVFRLAAVWFGKEGFSEYAVAKRTISFLQLPFLVGLGLSIPRTIAFLGNDPEKENKATAFLLTGILTEVLLFALICFFVIFMPGGMAFLFFGDAEYQHLVFPIWLAMSSGVLHILVYGYYRGHLRMIKANALQFLNLGLIPVLIFLVPNLSIVLFFTILGVSRLVVIILVLTTIFRAYPPLWKMVFRRTFMALLKYGLPRVPGELALTGLMALPVFFTTHIHGVTLAGQLAFAISLLSMVGALFSPIGLILLPAVSGMTARRKLAEFKPTFRKILIVSVGSCIIITVAGEWLAPFFIKMFLGWEFFEAVRVVRVILVGATPYVVYIVARNVLDAVEVRPLNSINLAVSLGLFCVLFFVIPGNPAPVALVLALFVLGMLSLWQVNRVFREYTS